MATIVTRAGKGSALTNNEIDANFTNLNSDKPDVEYGDWTPVISDGTNNATMAASNGGSYAKIGRLVTVTGQVAVSSLGSVSGAVRISGLPVASAAGDESRSSVVFGFASGLSITAGQSVGGHVVGGTDYILLSVWSGTTGTAAASNTILTASTIIRFSHTYLAT